MSLLNTTVLVGVFSSIPLSFKFRDILYGVEGWVQDNLSGIFPGEAIDGDESLSQNEGNIQASIWVFSKIGVFPPKSSILIGFSIINHPFWGTPIFGNTHLFYCFFFFASKLQTILRGFGGMYLSIRHICSSYMTG